MYGLSKLIHGGTIRKGWGMRTSRLFENLCLLGVLYAICTRRSLKPFPAWTFSLVICVSPNFVSALGALSRYMCWISSSVVLSGVYGALRTAGGLDPESDLQMRLRLLRFPRVCQCPSLMLFSHAHYLRRRLLLPSYSTSVKLASPSELLRPWPEATKSSAAFD
jgi:hypothetical protein